MKENIAPSGIEQIALSSWAKNISGKLREAESTFSERLFQIIDVKGLDEIEVYKRANIDRKLFSKIRKKTYRPSKGTALALSLVLRLDFGETMDLIGRAGHSLSRAFPEDIIVIHAINSGQYDINKINEALYCYKLPLLVK